MGDERLGRRAAVDGLQNRRFDFDEIVLVQKAAQRRHDRCARAEDLAHILVDCQVGVALAVARFGVRQGGMAHHLSVHHLILGGRQRGDGFGQHLEILHLQAHLAGARAHHLTARLDVIADVKKVLEDRHPAIAQFVDAQEQLDPAGAVFDVRECQLAHRADGAQAPA